MEYMNNLQFECIGLKPNGRFPLINTGRDQDKSPAFILKNLNPVAKSIAITLDDTSIPGLFGDFNHWLIWNIPVKSNIPAGIPSGIMVSSLDGAVQGIGYGKNKYAGPNPPKGSHHIYKFDIYVLDSKLNISYMSRKQQFMSAIKSHVIQHGSINGVFE